MYKILVFGGRGMLGHMVCLVLSNQEQFEVKSTSSDKIPNYIRFNIEKEIGSLKKIIEKFGPFDYIINCIGILNSSIHKEDSNSIKRAILINAYFPHLLAEITSDIGIKVIQISSDAVFSKDSGVCFEDNLCNCDDLYGKTKTLGEVISPNFLNIRCSIIGPSPYHGGGLLEWFSLQSKGSVIDGFSNQMWNGVTTLQFVKLCLLLIKDDYFDVVRKEAPIHHFCPNQVISKYEILKLFKTYLRPDINVKRTLNSGDAVSRTLGTRFSSINGIYGSNSPMKIAIEELT